MMLTVGDNACRSRTPWRVGGEPFCRAGRPGDGKASKLRRPRARAGNVRFEIRTGCMRLERACLTVESADRGESFR